MTPRQPSQDAFDMVNHFEGNKLICYRDTGGKPTIGRGHTKGLTDVDVGKLTISQEQSDQYLDDDLVECAQVINTHVKPDLTQQQFDALCDFIFNLGAGAFLGSTLFECINNCRFDLAAAEFDKWIYIHVNGVKVKSQWQINRRAAETALFVSGANDA